MSEDFNAGKPLDREEGTLYVTCVTEAIKDTNQKNVNAIIELGEAIKNTTNKNYDAVIDAIKANTRNQEKISDGLKELNGFISMLVKQSGRAAINNEESIIFYSVLDPEQKILWKDKVAGDIANICIETGKNKGNVYKELYEYVRRKGYDINALQAEFNKTHKDATLIDMCVESDTLRFMVENFVNTQYHYYTINKIKRTKKNFYSYKEVNGCPKVITDIVKKLSSSDRVSGQTYHKAYNLLGIDLNNYVHSIKKKYNLKHCSVPFAIAIDDDMLKKFENAVNKEIAKGAA